MSDALNKYLHELPGVIHVSPRPGDSCKPVKWPERRIVHVTTTPPTESEGRIILSAPEGVSYQVLDEGFGGVDGIEGDYAILIYGWPARSVLIDMSKGHLVYVPDVER